MPTSQEPAAAERLDRFMARAGAAYYATRPDPFGRAGDFTTAPEISQAFGECLGLWAAVTWGAMGAPDPALLVELGPGRGTLMADALRAVGQVAPGFRAALRVHLVEASPALRAVQARTLASVVATGHPPTPTLPRPAGEGGTREAGGWGCDDAAREAGGWGCDDTTREAGGWGCDAAAWHDDLTTVPPGPAIILANEFLDALPIRQFIRRGGTWREHFVQAGGFVEGPAEAPPPLPADAPEGAIQEVSEPGHALARTLAARLAAQGGAALFLDYGPAAGGFGDTLQAVALHGRADPLAAPGSVDLTAHVDFAAIAAAARAGGASVHGPLPQGLFLQRLGLMSRAAMLARSAALAGRRDGAGHILSGAERLVAPEGMGRLFKALCLCHPALPPPPGFEPT